MVNRLGINPVLISFPSISPVKEGSWRKLFKNRFARHSYLSSIEVDLFFDCTGADWTEVITGERVHQAIVARTVNTLGYIAAALVDTKFSRV